VGKFLFYAIMTWRWKLSILKSVETSCLFIMKEFILHPSSQTQRTIAKMEENYQSPSLLEFCVFPVWQNSHKPCVKQNFTQTFVKLSKILCISHSNEDHPAFVTPRWKNNKKQKVKPRTDWNQRAFVIFIQRVQKATKTLPKVPLSSNLWHLKVGSTFLSIVLAKNSKICINYHNSQNSSNIITQFVVITVLNITNSFGW
jgi:hypothetical protein